MSFPKAVKEEALFKSRRCCCVCHEFAGVYTNVHHIEPKAEGGANDLDNSIVLCLRCHGEAGHYNVQHPIGNKYSPSELRRHRDEWWEWCQDHPESSLPKHPIVVKPATFTLRGGRWRTRQRFKVHNRTDEILYQIWIRIRLAAPKILAESVKIVPRKRNDVEEELARIEADGGSIIVGDILSFTTNTSKHGMTILYRLASLNPSEVYEFELKVNLPGQPSIIEGKAFIRVCGFSQDSIVVKESPGEAAIPFTIPQDCLENEKEPLDH